MWTKNSTHDIPNGPNIQNELDIQNDLTAVIPKELRTEDFELTAAYLTTFSLDTSYLIKVLDSLGALHLIRDGKVHIFYDAFSRSVGQSSTQSISEKYLHAIKEKGAYHPKVILLRYQKKDKENDIRYAITVTSKNLTDSMLIDAFACAHGKVEESPNNSNGNKVADFFKHVFTKSYIIGEHQYLLDELKRTDFIQSNGSEIHFLTAREVSDRIKDKSDMIVVSPFLSDGFINSIEKDNLKMLVSTNNGFSGLKKETVKDLDSKTRVFPSDTLHAKIYCWLDKEDEKAHWIVGSSNATNNGCDIHRKSNNKEFNIEFCTEKSEYNAFTEMFDKSRQASPELCDDNAEAFNAAKHLRDFLGKVNIECSMRSEKKYICSIQQKPKISFDGYNVEIRISGMKEFKNVDSPLELVWNEPFPTIDIHIINPNEYVDEDNENNKGRVFCISLYEKWDESKRELLDIQADNAYSELMQNVVENIIKGRKGANKIPNIGISSGTQNRARHKQVNKNYIYEQMMTFASNYKDEESFRTALGEIKKYAVLCNGDYYKDLKNFIDKMEVSFSEK